MVLVVTVLSTIKGPWQTRTHCYQHKCFRLPAHATFVVDTNFVSGTQKVFQKHFVSTTKLMFPFLRSMETQHSFSFVSHALARPRNTMRNSVCNDVSLFARALMHRIASVGNDNFSLFTGHNYYKLKGVGGQGR